MTETNLDFSGRRKYLYPEFECNKNFSVQSVKPENFRIDQKKGRKPLSFTIPDQHLNILDNQVHVRIHCNRRRYQVQ